MSYPAGCITSHIDASCNGDAEPVLEIDELTTLDCGCTGTLRNAEESGGQLVCEAHLNHPVQLPDFCDRAERKML